MERADRQHVHYTTDDGKWPTALKKAGDVAELLGVSVERVLELADAHYLPHWRIDGGEPMFQLSEVRKWAARNLLTRFEGSSIPINLKVAVEAPIAVDAPASIREIPGLRQIPINDCPPGVYFLVHRDEVVYVGQSITPFARITSHKDKTFSRAYLLPVPSSKLNAVEGALIRTLKPPLNDCLRGPGEEKTTPKPSTDILL